VSGIQGELQLLNGRIIGWHQDRFEMGARALGNRSILAHPGSLSVAKRLSLSVKKRATFRPYALSITIEDAPRLLEFPGNVNSSCLRWMQCSVPVRADWVQRVRAGLHVDGTTRAQICRAEDNPKFHALLTAFGKRFGVSALLNTSFNMSGLPIHNRPVEALLHFASSDLDILVVNNLLLTKEYENVSTQSSA